jgi:hypothetical protein
MTQVDPIPDTEHVVADVIVFAIGQRLTAHEADDLHAG